MIPAAGSTAKLFFYTVYCKHLVLFSTFCVSPWWRVCSQSDQTCLGPSVRFGSSDLEQLSGEDSLWLSCLHTELLVSQSFYCSTDQIWASSISNHKHQNLSEQAALDRNIHGSQWEQADWEVSPPGCHNVCSSNMAADQTRWNYTRHQLGSGVIAKNMRANAKRRGHWGRGMIRNAMVLDVMHLWSRKFKCQIWSCDRAKVYIWRIITLEISWNCLYVCYWLRDENYLVCGQTYSDVFKCNVKGEGVIE